MARYPRNRSILAHIHLIYCNYAINCARYPILEQFGTWLSGSRVIPAPAFMYCNLLQYLTNMCARRQVPYWHTPCFILRLVCNLLFWVST
jgi:hypothetical protein